jgi:eukaryotic-like serine/threonine-protein kinase
VSSASPLKMGMALEGEQLGHFQLEEFVGGGGMGAVFRALDTMLGRVVAVKVLSRERTDADTLRRFKNEAQSAARLDHKNIARVHYVGEDNGWNYIVFEFIDGVNVRDLIEKKGPLDIEDALHFTMQIAEALDHAAQREVVHRDIKPSNIIITAGSRAKLVDMGLARLHQVESSNDDITASGVTLGTFDYISPEQARDPRIADVRSDIYSLGCTLYFMLCGRPPFPDGTVLQKLLNHNSERPEDLQIHRPDVPDDIVDVVNRMLAKQPSQRYQTPAELMSELLLLAQKYQLTKLTAPVELWTETKTTETARWERHLPWIAPLAILLLSVLAMDLVFPASQPNLSDLTPSARAAQASGRQAPAIGSAADAGPDEEPAPSAAERTSPSATPATDTTSPRGPQASIAADATRTPEQELAGGDLVPAADPDPSASQAVASDSRSNAKLPPGTGAKATSGAATAGTPATGVPATGTASSPERASSRPMPEPSGASPTTAKPAAEPARAVPPGVLVVSYHGETDEELWALLQEALRKASAADDIDEIQLDFDGPLLVPTTLHVEAQSLLISAATGKRPELIFRPAAGKASHSAMLAFRGDSLSLAGVRLTMHAPEEPSSEGWTMIYAGSRTQRIDMRDSVLTFDNPQAQIYDEHGAAFVRLEPLPNSRMASDPAINSTVADLTEIALERCIVRGAATFIRSRPGKALTVTWDQGLLATSERMLDVENAIGSTSPSSEVRLSLLHVTAVADKGLCRLGANSEAVSQPLPLAMELNGCIVRTLPDYPLVDQLGVDPSMHDAGMLFSLNDSMTLFSRTSIRRKFAGQELPTRLKSDSISWKNLVLSNSTPWHQHTSDGYLLDTSSSEISSNARSAGFDAQRLPQLPEAAEQEPLPAEAVGS